LRCAGRRQACLRSSYSAQKSCWPRARRARSPCYRLTHAVPPRAAVVPLLHARGGRTALDRYHCARPATERKEPGVWSMHGWTACVVLRAARARRDARSTSGAGKRGTPRAAVLPPPQRCSRPVRLRLPVAALSSPRQQRFLLVTMPRRLCRPARLSTPRPRLVRPRQTRWVGTTLRRQLCMALRLMWCAAPTRVPQGTRGLMWSFMQHPLMHPCRHPTLRVVALRPDVSLEGLQ
jgi:hypothetical protein